jgi:hypothetical protein
MTAHNLSKTEVGDLIYSYRDPAVTDQLYAFGAIALGEIQERTGRINSQSATVLGWATAILAFLFAGISRSSGSGLGFVLCSAILALAAVICSFNALRTRPNWGASDQSWIHQTALVNEDELKRYHVRVLHDVRKRRLVITNAKSRSLLFGEVCLILASLTLFAGIAHHLLLAKAS